MNAAQKLLMGLGVGLTSVAAMAEGVTLDLSPLTGAVSFGGITAAVIGIYVLKASPTAAAWAGSMINRVLGRN